MAAQKIFNNTTTLCLQNGTTSPKYQTWIFRGFPVSVHSSIHCLFYLIHWYFNPNTSPGNVKESQHLAIVLFLQANKVVVYRKSSCHLKAKIIHSRI